MIKQVTRTRSVLVGTAAAVGMALLLPLGATGADGQNVVLGASNLAASTTFISAQPQRDGAIVQINNGTEAGTGNSMGLRASAGVIGLQGTSERLGVFGSTTGNAPLANADTATPSVGVGGYAQNEGATAMAATGNNNADAFVATLPMPTATGTAATIIGRGAQATALDVSGRVKFSSAGVGAIPKGSVRTTVTPQGVSQFRDGDMVLVTLQGNPSAKNKVVSFSHVELNYAAHTFDVVLSGQAASDTPFLYFIVTM